MDEYEVRAAKIIQEAKNSGHSYAGNHPVYWNIESLGDDYGVGCFFDEEEKVWKLYENGDRGSHYIFMVTDDESAAEEKLLDWICGEFEKIDTLEMMENKRWTDFLNDSKRFVESDRNYGETRSQALFLKSSDIGMPDLIDDIVFAVVADISQDDGTTATLVCTLRRDVEFYHSSGKVYRRLDREGKVNNTALKLLASAKEIAKGLEEAKNFPLPPKGTTTAYFLTNGGITKVDMKFPEKFERKNWFIYEWIQAVRNAVQAIGR